MTTNALKWTRIDETAGWGYRTDGAEIWDNGNGMGSSRDSGRWAVEIGGRWVRNMDTLEEAKALVAERLT